MKIPGWKLFLSKNSTVKKVGFYLAIISLVVIIAKLITFSFIYGIEMLMFFHPLWLVSQFLFIIGLTILAEYWLFGRLARIQIPAVEFLEIIKKQKIRLNRNVYRVKKMEIKKETIKANEIKGKLILKNNLNVNFSSLRDNHSYTLTEIGVKLAETNVKQEVNKIVLLSALLSFAVSAGIYFFVA